MDRIAIALFTLVIAFLGGCTTSTKKPAKVLNLRDVYDVKACPLHHVPLQDGVEPIKAGHISWDFRYFDARNKIFPLANIGDMTLPIMKRARHSLSSAPSVEKRKNAGWTNRARKILGVINQSSNV